MIDADKPRLAEWLTGCAEVYDKTVSTAGISVWWGILSHFPTDAVDRAFKAHVADPDTGRRMPTPADIVGRIMGGSEAAAAEAWTKVLSVIAPCGWNLNVVFDDPLIHASIAAIGGWKFLTRTPNDQLGYRRHEFMAAYKGWRQRGERPAYPPVMLGQFPKAKATLVGDVTKAKAVFGGGYVPDTLPTLRLVELSESIDATVKRIAGAAP
jgi:hypothetical protein